MAQSSTNDPFTGLILDEEEQGVEDAMERGDFTELPGLDDTKKMLWDAASRYSSLNTTKPITLRVKQIDLVKIKAKAKRSNIPYQTLLSALLHDFAEGHRELSIK